MKTDIDSLNKLDLEGLNNQLVKACAMGNLDLVETLLISPKLKLHPDISVNNEHPLRWACDKNQVKVIKYLLSSPILKKHADIHAMLDMPFKEALRHENTELFQFYIFDLKIEKTEFIEKALAEHGNKTIVQELERMFQARDLEEALSVNNKNEKSRLKL